MSTWIAPRAKYPHCRSKDLWTRFHLLRRKVGRQGGAITPNDKRAAQIVGGYMAASSPASPERSGALEWLSVIVDG